MRCRLFTLLSMMSLLLCVGTCVLWVCSYRHEPCVVFGRTYSWQELGVEGGNVIFEDWVDIPDGEGDDPPDIRIFHFRSWMVFGNDGSPPWRGELREFSLQWVLLPTTVLPILYLYRYCLRRGRAQPCDGHCPSCGYDLRATPDRCPECGAVPAGAKA
jgi:hypothetical protein